MVILMLLVQVLVIALAEVGEQAPNTSALVGVSVNRYGYMIVPESSF